MSDNLITYVHNKLCVCVFITNNDLCHTAVLFCNAHDS